MELYSIKELFMNKEKSLHKLAKQCSEGLQASALLSVIILEKYLAGILPETRLISMKELNKITDYNYVKLRKFLGNNYYRVKGKKFNIIADNQLLAREAKSNCKYLIVELVIPSQPIDSFDNRVFLYIIDSDFTVEEREFINLMLNDLIAVASIKEFSSQISERDLCDFNTLNANSFDQTAKKVYNDVLQKKLHAGDNIMEYLKTDLSDKEIAERLEKSCKFDYFFDKDGFLKCDLDTNKTILIKNFLNTLLYGFKDLRARNILLLKLNSKYPLLNC